MCVSVDRRAGGVAARASDSKKGLSMKTVSYVLAILLAACAPTYAQAELAGTWRAEGVGPQPWTLVLRTTGPSLTGTVSSCASPSVEIYDLNRIGNTITFKCKSLDGDRTISFTGAVNEDQI